MIGRVPVQAAEAMLHPVFDGGTSAAAQDWTSMAPSRGGYGANIRVLLLRIGPPDYCLLLAGRNGSWVAAELDIRTGGSYTFSVSGVGKAKSSPACSFKRFPVRDIPRRIGSLAMGKGHPEDDGGYRPDITSLPLDPHVFSHGNSKACLQIRALGMFHDDGS